MLSKYSRQAVEEQKVGLRTDARHNKQRKEWNTRATRLPIQTVKASITYDISTPVYIIAGL